jgi:hypothetical protein
MLFCGQLGLIGRSYLTTANMCRYFECGLSIDMSGKKCSYERVVSDPIHSPLAALYKSRPSYCDIINCSKTRSGLQSLAGNFGTYPMILFQMIESFFRYVLARSGSHRSELGDRHLAGPPSRS